jgi:mRNA interferase RelE/StbE
VGRFRVVIKASAAKELEAVDGKRNRQRLAAAIGSLADDPWPAGVEKLSGMKDRFRIRVGDWRVVYAIEDAVLTVYVVNVGQRREVCR